MGALVQAAFFIAFHLTVDAKFQGSATTESQFVEGCDSIRFARLYTYCAVPFYVDFYPKDVPERSACMYVHGFKTCTDRAGRTAQCVGHQYVLKPTLRYFTSIMLETYTKSCNITDDIEDIAVSPPEITVIIHGKRTHRSVQGQQGQHRRGSHRRYFYGDDHQGQRFYTSGSPEEQNQAMAAKGDVSLEANSPPDNRTRDEVLDSRFRSNSEVHIEPLQNKTRDTDDLAKGLQEDRHPPESNPLPTDIELWTTTPTSGRGRRLMQGQTTCGPPFPPSFTYPGECDKKTFLRRFFTCGIAFQHNFDANDPCICYVSYRRCVQTAKAGLKCDAVPIDDDPLMISVKVLTDLMTTMYDIHCFDNVTNSTSARARALPGDCCNQQLGLKKAIMCYATYFYLSDMTTPVLWPNTHGTCSLVQDLQRCIIFAQQHTECTECRIGRHVNKFVGAVIRPHHEECLTNRSSTSAQSLGPYMKENCRHTQVFKRALTCALGFQDMVELESTTEYTGETVLCGHASRLHICLEDSVEGTGCAGDTHISSQLKMYKKVLEDEYKIHCNVLIKRERALVNVRQRKHSALRGAPVRPRDILIYDNYDNDVQQTSNVKPGFAGPRYTLRGENEDDADYERFKSDAAHLQRLKLDTEGRKEAVIQWDMERQQSQPDPQPSEENWMKDFQKWQLLKQEQPVVPDAGRNGFQANRMQETLEQLGAGGNNPKLESSRVVANPKDSNERGALSPVSKNVLVAGLTGSALRHAGFGKVATGKRDYEEEYFGNEDAEPLESVRVPEETMLRQSESVVHAPSGQEAEDNLPCSEEKLQVFLRRCEASLMNAISNWPRLSDGKEELINVEAGRNAICEGVLKLQTCLLDALISSHCNRPQIFNDVLAEFNKRISLSICATEWNGPEARNESVALNASLAGNASLALNASQALQQSRVPQASRASQCFPELGLLSLFALVNRMRFT